MAQSKVLHWMDGRGWLVLSGGHDDASPVRAQALGRLAADGGVAYISFGSEFTGEGALADMDDLGAPAGYLVDVLAEDDETIIGRLADAGMIVAVGGESADQVRSNLMGAAAQGMQTAFQNGAVILAEGFSAMALGAWMILASGRRVEGLDWLHHALIMPGIASISQSEAARQLLYDEGSSLALGIGLGSALALGPDGEVETWGKRQVAIALGRDYGV